ncbi:MAG: succinate dehydrogenase, hydrophobic membrane anchor protein [Steroidobacteraceae bacterium]
MSTQASTGAADRAPDRHATRHWRNQRLTAICLVPLGLWFLLTLLLLPDLGYATVRAWIARPAQAVLLLLFAWFALWHSAQGVQAVVDDYVGGRLHAPTTRMLQLAHWIAALAVAWSIWVIAGSGA